MVIIAIFVPPNPNSLTFIIEKFKANLEAI
jgi:hypothetical protein